jgi:hypothetical protein
MNDSHTDATEDYFGRIRGVRQFASDRGTFNSIIFSGEKPRPNDDYRIHCGATAKKYIAMFGWELVKKAVFDYDSSFDITENVENCPDDLTGYPWA